MPIEFRGNNLETLYCREPEFILSGPAGTGKSLTLLNMIMMMALKYPGSRLLIARKTRASLTESGLVTWESKVLPKPLYEQIAASMQRRQRSSYIFPNKSEVVVGGLDKPTKIMSTEYDVIYVQEALEIGIQDWEALNSRLRNNMMPHQILCGDTNPDAPKHWILQRANAGILKLIESRHEDNPSLFRADGTITPFGQSYIARLDKLTGARLARLRYGRWVQSEGVVYSEFDRALHLINRFEETSDNPDGNPPRQWTRYWVIDFGYTNPFVCQWWAEDPDGRLYLYREIYMPGRLVSEHADIIKKLSQNEPSPVAIICDHDAEGRATLVDKLDLGTTAAHKSVSSGIQAVKRRLKPAGDGRPRLYILADSLHQRDPGLAELMLPASTLEEFDSYIWDTSSNRVKGEEPVKKFDHGMDAMRYMVAYRDLKNNEVGYTDGFLDSGDQGSFDRSSSRPINESFFDLD